MNTHLSRLNALEHRALALFDEVGRLKPRAKRTAQGIVQTEIEQAIAGTVAGTMGGVGGSGGSCLMRFVGCGGTPIAGAAVTQYRYGFPAVLDEQTTDAAGYAVFTPQGGLNTLGVTGAAGYSESNYASSFLLSGNATYTLTPDHDHFCVTLCDRLIDTRKLKLVTRWGDILFPAGTGTGVFKLTQNGLGYIWNTAMYTSSGSGLSDNFYVYRNTGVSGIERPYPIWYTVTLTAAGATIAVSVLRAVDGFLGTHPAAPNPYVPHTTFVYPWISASSVTSSLATTFDFCDPLSVTIDFAGTAAELAFAGGDTTVQLLEIP